MAQTAALNGNRRQTHQNLYLGALGVVYGDIGTSPLYTVKLCFVELGSVITPFNVYGVLSLLTWALIVVVTFKYVTLIMRADNRGEGGILALTALALRASTGRRRLHWWILAAGLLGASLFYGDGVITPAISLLGSIEGLKVATPLFEPYVIPITLMLLVVLFAMQRHGTARIGSAFGPIIFVWFIVIGLLGVVQILRQPRILLALNPIYGINLLLDNPTTGLFLLGAVVLVFTGCETLYADMGHFGRRPIRADWLFFVFPALMLNYLGQGALLLANPTALANPFYLLAPKWALYPMVVLAAAATVIASQAVISGAFSMTQQAVQLGYLPRLQVRHTSEEEIGQIYVPRVNLFLFVAVAALVIGFKSADNLGTAYGIAVTGTMTLTTVLALVYSVGVARWNPLYATLVFGFFLFVDLLFFGANMLKFVEGGWFPVAVGVVVFITMSTWMEGRDRLAAQRAKGALPLSTFLNTVKPGHPERVDGTAVFMTANPDLVPAALLHNLKHNKVLHERVVLMKIETCDIPHVPDDQRIEVKNLEHNFHTVTVRYGFIDEPNIPRTLAQLRLMRLKFNLMETSFFIGREKVVISASTSRLWRWRKRLFIFLQATMVNATEFFRIPSNRVVELGGQIEI
ncbi:MAG: potassium transporter Kup [Alphaproteobacteria bacterium]|nr:potassium transporter Kup [Alphaproteobacteria bacterium]